MARYSCSWPTENREQLISLLSGCCLRNPTSKAEVHACSREVQVSASQSCICFHIPLPCMPSCELWWTKALPPSNLSTEKAHLGWVMRPCSSSGDGNAHSSAGHPKPCMPLSCLHPSKALSIAVPVGSVFQTGGNHETNLQQARCKA